MGALRNFPLKEILSVYPCQVAIELGSGYGTGIYELLGLTLEFKCSIL